MKRYEKIDPDSWNDILKYVLALSLFFSFCGGGGWFLLHCYNKKWIKILLVVTYDPKVVGNVYRVNESISVFCYNTKKNIQNEQRKIWTKIQLTEKLIWVWSILETTDWSRYGALTTRGRPWPQTLPLANDQKCPKDQLKYITIW